ncbi:hypothetical protein G7Y89_g4315 [Cudoniella acicularis]|uniref:Uncharacterized protein n=1 Tax=Cudoniella acicularis TaxID=354080 RepID=A0A8H4RR50_9HELO|nr:hypothetical protein G7Y89_g4315 [Cudoniella acicularis]
MPWCSLKSLSRSRNPSTSPDAPQPPPPPYSTSSLQPLSLKGANLQIQATDVPQWEWTRAQCQEWFAQILIVKMNYSVEEAAAIADKLEGWGPSIYTRRIQDWEEILGRPAGVALYVSLVRLRRKEGAVPLWVKLPSVW